MAADSMFEPLTGGCACNAITYTIIAPPLCTHCCHCTHCQRETGSTFAVNILIESSNFQLTSSMQPMVVNTPTKSGAGQLIARCPACFAAVYSTYGGAGPLLTFVKAGTLDDTCRQRITPDVHIYTNAKAEWVDLRGEAERGAKICEEYYDNKEVWTKESLERLQVLKG